jgi:hypothetical protein
MQRCSPRPMFDTIDLMTWSAAIHCTLVVRHAVFVSLR